MSDTVIFSPEQSEKNAVSPASSSAGMTVGEQLRQARIAQELTIEQIADQLKWHVRQIMQVEAGNYTVLPNHSIARGFVRTYAKILKLDVTPLMEALSVELVRVPPASIERTSLEMPFSSGRMLLNGRDDQRPYRFAGSVILVLLVLTAMFVYRSELASFIQMVLPGQKGSAADYAIFAGEKKKASPEVHPVVSSSDSGESQSENHSSIAAPDISGNESASELSTKLLFAGSPYPVGKALSIENRERNTGNSVSTTQQNSRQPNTLGKLDNRLDLKFNNDSWVQIKRQDGTNVVARLYKAGEKESININEPMNLVIGFAPGVEAQYRGQPLLLTAKKDSTVVALDLSRL